MSANPQKIPGVGFIPRNPIALWAKNGSPVDPFSGRPQDVRHVPIDFSAPDPYGGKVFQEHGDRAIVDWPAFVRMFMGGDPSVDDGREMVGESNERWEEGAFALMAAFEKGGYPEIKGTRETHTGIPTLLEVDLLRATTFKGSGIYGARAAAPPRPTPPSKPPVPPVGENPTPGTPPAPPAAELQPVPAEVLRTAEEMGNWQGEIGQGKRARLRRVARFLASIEGYKAKG